ncbi:MAG: hypothetical protein QGG40_20480 [Myxococcota bacterium]|nr:hypothetical protein [Myxococcota bacterium]
MNSFFARNRLSAFIDGDLSRRDRVDVARAIEQDSALRSEYEALHNAVQVLRRYGPCDPPAGFATRVGTELLDVSPGARGGIRRAWARFPPEGRALLVVAMILGLVLLGRQSDDAPLAMGEGDELPTVVSTEESDRLEPGSMDEESESALAELVPEDSPPPARPDASGSVTKIADAMPLQASATAKPRPRTGNTPASQSTPARDIPEGSPYRIEGRDGAILKHLASIASQAGGHLQDTRGQAMNIRLLTVEDNFARARLVIPRDNTAEVESSLSRQSLAAQGRPSPSSDGTSDIFHVEVTFQP